MLATISAGMTNFKTGNQKNLAGDTSAEKSEKGKSESAKGETKGGSESGKAAASSGETKKSSEKPGGTSAA